MFARQGKMNSKRWTPTSLWHRMFPFGHKIHPYTSVQHFPLLTHVQVYDVMCIWRKNTRHSHRVSIKISPFTSDWLLFNNKSTTKQCVGVCVSFVQVPTQRRRPSFCWVISKKKSCAPLILPFRGDLFSEASLMCSDKDTMNILGFLGLALTRGWYCHVDQSRFKQEV